MITKKFLKQEIEILLTTTMNILASSHLTTVQAAAIRKIEKQAWVLRATTMPKNSVAHKILAEFEGPAPGTKGVPAKLARPLTTRMKNAIRKGFADQPLNVKGEG